MAEIATIARPYAEAVFKLASEGNRFIADGARNLHLLGVGEELVADDHQEMLLEQ